MVEVEYRGNPERNDDENSLRLRLQKMEKAIAYIQKQIIQPNVLEPIFPATVGTDGSFTPLVMSNGTLTSFPVFTGTASFLASGQSVLMQMIDPPNVRFLVIGGGGGVGSENALLQITGDPAGTGPTTWNPYPIVLQNGQTGSGWNAMEPIDAGLPGAGPLGVIVGADGSLPGTTCFGQPIGVSPEGGWIPATYSTSSGYWHFAVPNSFQGS